MTTPHKASGSLAHSAPRVSVIVIFLNEERFLEEAIDSVLTQTYPDWELLLIDDGSTDASTAIAQAVAARHPDRVRYLEHEGHQNLGMSAARNLGLRHARGQFVAYLDGDDVWVPHKLERQVALIDANPEAAMVYGPLLHWRTWAGSPEASTGDSLAGAGRRGVHPYADALVPPPTLLELFLSDDYFIPGGILIRRDVIDRVGGYEETFRALREDAVFYVKLCLTYPVYVSSEVLYKFRVHADSCNYQSATHGDDQRADLIYLNWCARYLTDRGVTDGRVWRALNRALWRCRHPRTQRLIHFVQRWRGRVGRVRAALTSVAAARRAWPPVGMVRFGNLRRTAPIGRVWPNHRGTPIDRYYIEAFLGRHAADVRGRVLELGDASYTTRFGRDRVTRSDVLDRVSGNPAATLVGDLTQGEHFPTSVFDCIILTQALLLIYDVRAAVATLHRMLKPGGVLLVTVPGITPIVRDDMLEHGQYWSFTQQSVRRLLEEVFPARNVTVEAHGNALTATAFLQGLATRDLKSSEFDVDDPDFELIIAARAVKP